MAEINFGEEVSKEDIENNLKEINDKIFLACMEANREPSEIDIVAITKTHSIATVRNAIDAGLTQFGENRYQELHEKKLATEKIEKVKWHFVGQIQRNKMARIADEADVICSVDRPEQLDIISKARHKPKLLIQLSADGDEKRGGVLISNAIDLMIYAQNVGPLISGVMMVPPLGADPRPHFNEAAQFA
ncbi:MAG TPA: alanine racemase, partial [Acidimicrobiia bacterium]|nr:alanine racemase [Acidimicrobiia bacterium]